MYFFIYICFVNLRKYFYNLTYMPTEIKKSFRQRVIDIEPGDKDSFPIEKFQTIRAIAYALKYTHDRIYTTNLDPDERLIHVIRQK